MFSLSFAPVKSYLKKLSRMILSSRILLQLTLVKLNVYKLNFCDVCVAPVAQSVSAPYLYDSIGEMRRLWVRASPGAPFFIFKKTCFAIVVKTIIYPLNKYPLIFCVLNKNKVLFFLNHHFCYFAFVIYLWALYTVYNSSLIKLPLFQYLFSHLPKRTQAKVNLN